MNPTVYKVQDALIKLSSAKNADITPLDQSEVAKALSTIRDKFCDPQKKSAPLWEAVGKPKSYYQHEGVAFVAEFFGGAPRKIVMLIDDWYRMTGVWTDQSHRVPELLEDMPTFVWYITDPAFSFLLCHNDHEFVIFAE